LFLLGVLRIPYARARKRTLFFIGHLAASPQTATAARSACHTPSKSSGLEQVTNFGGFTSFPEFSPDGKTLVFCSDKDAKERYEFNIFTVKWGK